MSKKKKPTEEVTAEQLYMSAEVKFYLLAKLLYNINPLRSFATVRRLLSCMVSESEGWETIIEAITKSEEKMPKKADRLFLAFLRELREEVLGELKEIGLEPK